MGNVSQAHVPQTIYTLACPDTEYIFYVGRTTMPLYKRLCCHITSKLNWNQELTNWFQKISSTGKKPLIQEIDRVPHFQRKTFEEFWTQQLEAWGFNLTNKRYIDFKNSKKRDKRMTHFSQQEKRIIELMVRHGDNFEIAKDLNISEETIRLTKARKTIPKWHHEAVVDFYAKRAKEIAEWYNNYINNKTE